MELRDYLRIVRRRWKLISACVLAAIAVATLLTVRSTPQYESRARLFVSTQQDDSTQAYQGSLFSAQRATSYADLTRDLSGRVVDRLDLEASPTALGRRVTASVVPETVILQLTVTDSDPRQAQELSQAFAEELIDFVDELETPRGGGPAPIKVTIVADATLPTGPVSPQPVRNVGLAIMLGLMFGLGIAVLRELLDYTVKSEAEVAGLAGAPVMASIAFDPAAQKRPLVTSLDSHAPRIEAFRVLRTNMQFVDVDQQSKIFVVSSAVPQEGKTTTAANLAITLAQTGQRVLLVDGDLRRPKVANSFGVDGAVGVTTVLVGRIELEAALQGTDIENLTVLTSGAIPPNPSELLQSQAMEALLERLRSQFEIIVIDAPPLLPVTDAALLASMSDGALLVVRHGKTTKDQLSHAIERLQSVDARAIGVVLNMVPQGRTGGGSYGYGYGYGYGYAPEGGRRKGGHNSPKVTEPSNDVHA